MARTLTRDERALWRTAMRDVRQRDAEAPPAPRAEPEPVPPPALRTRPRLAPEAQGLDRRSAQRLKRGQMALEARVDLHGMTADEAHRTLLRFLARAWDEGRRAVLVITGKGGEGILRAGVPRWLAEPPVRQMILGIEEAQPRHGGAGARYVLLRRKRR